MQEHTSKLIVQIKRCIARIVGVKKTEAAGDRMIRFLGLFLKTSTERDADLFNDQKEGEEIDESIGKLIVLLAGSPDLECAMKSDPH